MRKIHYFQQRTQAQHANDQEKAKSENCLNGPVNFSIHIHEVK